LEEVMCDMTMAILSLVLSLLQGTNSSRN